MATAAWRRGVAVSTYGKVIKRGWDWLGVTPANQDCIGGLIEAPALAECLTLNRVTSSLGAAGATYLAYRRAIQEVVTRQLAEWGDDRAAAERTQRRVARPVERDLENVLVDLADDFLCWHLWSSSDSAASASYRSDGRVPQAMPRRFWRLPSVGSAEVRATAATTEHPQEDKGGGAAPPATDGSPSPPVSPEPPLRSFRPLPARSAPHVTASCPVRAASRKTR